MSPVAVAGPSSSPSSSSLSLPPGNVLLALPDGPIPPSDPARTSYTSSFIGGYPSFPALTSAQKAPEDIRCGVCHKPIPLLAQIYCPPEGGENDRTVYVWACGRSACQRREGSVRAYRASRRNEEYVQDVRRRREEEEKEREAERQKARANPFSMNGSATGSSLFGGDAPLFGAPAAPAPSSSSLSNTSAPPDLSSLSIASTSSNITLAPPLPAFQPPQFLSTIEEYLPPPEEMDVDDDDDDIDGAPGGQNGWRDERWEQLLPKHMDAVFDRFVRRLETAEDGSTQVLRYELGGIPLPYSSTSPLFNKLFPNAPKTAKSPDQGDEEDIEQFYSASSIPPCPRCGAQRVFELQLVPALISLLQPDSISTTGEPVKLDKRGKQGKEAEEERRKELAKIAAGAAAAGGNGGPEADQGEMEWGTVMIFGCEGDCEGIGEEWVGVEWESLLSQ